MCAGAEVGIAHSSSASVDKRTIHVCWRLVTPRSSNPSFGWMITTTDTVYLKPYLCCQLSVFGIEVALSTNDQLPIECNSPPPTLPHDSRVVVLFHKSL